MDCNSIFEINPKWLSEKQIDFSKLKPDFMPGFQKEKECYKKAIIVNAKDYRGRTFKEPQTWPRDPQPGEEAYYRWVKESTDFEMNWNPARDEDGNPIKGTRAKYIVDQITRVRTAEGEFLTSKGRLQGYDHMGNEKNKSCNNAETWIETIFKFHRSPNGTGQIITQCMGPSGTKTHYDLPFTVDNLRKLLKDRAADNIPFVLKDELTSAHPRGMPNLGTIESRIKFFMKDFDYLFKGEYIPKEERAWNKKLSEYILTGKAKDEQEAAHMAEMEEENKKPPERKDSKTGVA